MNDPIPTDLENLIANEKQNQRSLIETLRNTATFLCSIVTRPLVTLALWHYVREFEFPDSDAEVGDPGSPRPPPVL